MVADSGGSQPCAPSGGEWQGLCGLWWRLCRYRSSLAQGRGGDLISVRLDGSGHCSARYVHDRARLAGQAVAIQLPGIGEFYHGSSRTSQVAFIVLMNWTSVFWG